MVKQSPHSKAVRSKKPFLLIFRPFSFFFLLLPPSVSHFSFSPISSSSLSSLRCRQTITLVKRKRKRKQKQKQKQKKLPPRSQPAHPKKSKSQTETYVRKHLLHIRGSKSHGGSDRNPSRDLLVLLELGWRWRTRSCPRRDPPLCRRSTGRVPPSTRGLPSTARRSRRRSSPTCAASSAWPTRSRASPLASPTTVRRRYLRRPIPGQSTFFDLPDSWIAMEKRNQSVEIVGHLLVLHPFAVIIYLDERPPTKVDSGRCT